MLQYQDEHFLDKTLITNLIYMHLQGNILIFIYKFVSSFNWKKLPK